LNSSEQEKKAGETTRELTRVIKAETCPLNVIEIENFELLEIRRRSATSFQAGELNG
jgi:hypothetical protein